MTPVQELDTHSHDRRDGEPGYSLRLLRPPAQGLQVFVTHSHDPLKQTRVSRAQKMLTRFPGPYEMKTRLPKPQEMKTRFPGP